MAKRDRGVGTECALNFRLKKLEAGLKCSLCLDYFKEPKLLPCFHVFCKSPCLEKLVNKGRQTLICPTCRHVVQLTERGVAGLQSDFHIEHLFEIKEAFDKATDSTGTQCGNCGEGKGTAYCQDCGEYICAECHTAHKKWKQLKGHNVISLEEIRSQATQLKPLKKLPNCPKHSDNPLKIYCETCSVLICYDCTIALHRDHSYNLVADLFPKHREELVSSLKPIKENVELVQKALKKFDFRGKNIHEERATLEANIHKEIDQLHRVLDERRAQLLAELEKLTQQKVKELAAQRDLLETSQAKMSSCLEYTQSGLESGSEGEVLAMKAPVMERIQQLLADFDPSSLRLETEAGIEIISDGKRELQNALGGFLQLEESIFSLENSKLEIGDVKVGQQKIVTFTARNMKNMPFKHKLDLKAVLSDNNNKNKLECEVAAQQSGQYLISIKPKSRKNNKLHLTINGNQIPGSPFKLPVLPTPDCFQQPTRVIRGLTNPRGVSMNSIDHLVVVDNNGSSVSILTADGVKIRSFGSRGSEAGQMNNTYDVTVDKDDNIYVTEASNHRVQKFSPEGESVKLAGFRGNNNLEFYGPIGITYNHKDNLLYVVDNCNCRIQVLTTDLTFVRAFGKLGADNGQFNNPHYIAFDSANNIYVSDCNNHRVQVLSTAGEFMRGFPDDHRPNRAHAIAVDSNNTTYVSKYDGQGLSVKVYSSQGDYITLLQEGIICRGLSIDNNDTLIVSDNKNGCLYFYR